MLSLVSFVTRGSCLFLNKSAAVVVVAHIIIVVVVFVARLVSSLVASSGHNIC